MSELKQRQIVALQQQVREDGVINGFHYPYARLLLNKAIELRAANQIATPSNPNFPNSHQSVSAIASMVCLALENQTGCPSMPSGGHFDKKYVEEKIDAAIAAATEFLAIFEDKSTPA